MYLMLEIFQMFRVQIRHSMTMNNIAYELG